MAEAALLLSLIYILFKYFDIWVTVWGEMKPNHQADHCLCVIFFRCWRGPSSTSSVWRRHWPRCWTTPTCWRSCCRGCSGRRPRWSRGTRSRFLRTSRNSKTSSRNTRWASQRPLSRHWLEAAAAAAAALNSAGVCDSQMFMEEMTRKQPDVDKVTKSYKRKPAEAPSSLAERRGARKFLHLTVLSSTLLSWFFFFYTFLLLFSNKRKHFH